jgi:hypothetical protein
MIGNIHSMKAFTFGTDKTWAEVATITTAEQTVNAPGVKVGDFVHIEAPTHQAGLDYNPAARVASDGVLTVKFSNPTAAGITPTAALAWRGLLFRPELPLTNSATI